MVAIAATLGKVGIVFAVGRGELGRRVGPTLLLVAAVGAGVLWLL